MSKYEDQQSIIDRLWQFAFEVEYFGCREIGSPLKLGHTLLVWNTVVLAEGPITSHQEFGYESENGKRWPFLHVKTQKEGRDIDQTYHILPPGKIEVLDNTKATSEATSGMRTIKELTGSLAILASIVRNPPEGCLVHSISTKSSKYDETGRE